MSSLPISADDLVISDHALIRYIERIKRQSLDQYRDEIKALLVEHYDNPIPGDGYHDDGSLFILEANTVVTVLSDGMRPKRMRRSGSKRNAWGFRTAVHVPVKKEAAA